MKKAIVGILITGIMLSVVGCEKEKAVYYSEIKDKGSITATNNTKDDKTDGIGFNADERKSEESNVEDFDYEFYDYREGIVIRKYHGSEKKVVIPQEIEGYPVVSIGGSAFRETDVEHVELPNSLYNIQPKAFLDCNSLTEIEIPENVGDIYSDAFSRCKKLEQVTICSKTVRIRDCAFFDCEELEKVRFKYEDDSVVLEQSPFYGCPNLDEESREAILKRNPKLIWTNERAGFRFDAFGRSKQ